MWLGRWSGTRSEDSNLFCWIEGERLWEVCLSCGGVATVVDVLTRGHLFVFVGIGKAAAAEGRKERVAGGGGGDERRE